MVRAALTLTRTRTRTLTLSLTLPLTSATRYTGMPAFSPTLMRTKQPTTTPSKKGSPSHCSSFWRVSRTRSRSAGPARGEGGLRTWLGLGLGLG